MIDSHKPANPALQDWLSHRYAKRHIDDIVNRRIRDWAQRKPLLRILTLPAAYWSWERQFSNTFPAGRVEFFGMESNLEVWRQMRRNVRSVPVSRGHVLNPLNRFEFSRRALQSGRLLLEEPFDMIYMDWMGSWSKDKQDQLTLIFEHDMLSRDSILRFTVSLQRGHPDKWKELQDVGDGVIEVNDFRVGGGPIQNWRTQGIAELVKTIGADFRYRVKPLGLYLYQNHHLLRAPSVGSFLFQVRR